MLTGKTKILLLLVGVLAAVFLAVILIYFKTPDKRRFYLEKGLYGAEKITGGFIVEGNEISLGREKLMIDAKLFTAEEKEAIINNFIYKVVTDKETFNDLGRQESFLAEVNDFEKFFDEVSFDGELITLRHSGELPLAISVTYDQSQNFLNFFFKDKNFIATIIPLLEIPKEIDENAPMIALTFDDGPSAKFTMEILNALNEHDSHATFFVLGSKVKGKEEIINSIIDSGSEIGGHSWDHPHLTQISESEYERQFLWVKDVVRDASYSNYEIKLFRPTYGEFNKKIKEYSPYPLILWSIDTLDWKNKDADLIVERVLNEAKDGSIVLMHDTHETTKDAAVRLIPLLKEKGFRIVTVSEMFAAKGITLEIGKVYNNAK